jgi:tryptophan synthase alpha chain
MRNRIHDTFAALKKKKEKGLIGYITAGFPTRASFRVLVRLLEEAGLDLLEVGVPFSDPIADGPMIQESSQIALKQNAHLGWILKEIAWLRANGIRLPLVLMTYSNPIYAMGVKSFFQAAKQVGVDGVIIPDMIPEESDLYRQAAKLNGLSLIYLVAPTTPKKRIKQIAARSDGFLYAVSVTGVTGARSTVQSHVPQFLKTVKSASRIPVAVGFGVSTPAQARDISRYADAVIVGSSLIREIQKSQATRFSGAVRFVRSLKGALYAA